MRKNVRLSEINSENEILFSQIFNESYDEESRANTMITRQDTINAWRKIINAMESDEGVRILRDCAVLISNKFEGTNLKASCNPSERRIYVSENLDRDELLAVLAHEACHVLERDKGLEVLTGKEMANLFEILKKRSLEDTRAGSEALNLMSYIYGLSKEWADADKVDDYIDGIEECLDNLEEIKLSGGVSDKYFWNWFAYNMDKIDEAVAYYQCGGHNDEWLDWRDKLENALQIEIELAN